MRLKFFLYSPGDSVSFWERIHGKNSSIKRSIMTHKDVVRTVEWTLLMAQLPTRNCSPAGVLLLDAASDELHIKLLPELTGAHEEVTEFWRESSPAGRCNKLLRPRHSHPDGRSVRRTGNSEKAQVLARSAQAFLPRTSPKPGASSCHECACRPTALPSGRGTLVRPLGSSKRNPFRGIFCVWPTPDSTLPLRSG